MESINYIIILMSVVLVRINIFCSCTIVYRRRDVCLISLWKS